MDIICQGVQCFVLPRILLNLIAKLYCTVLQFSLGNIPQFHAPVKRAKQRAAASIGHSLFTNRPTVIANVAGLGKIYQSRAHEDRGFANLKIDPAK